MKNTIIKKNKSMKNAYIENILLWMVMFIGFASLFFFVIDYARIIRVKDNMDTLSDYGARFISINGRANLAQLATGLNTIKVSNINTITAGNISCPFVVNNTYQSIFTITTTNNSYKFYTNNLSSTRAVFNQTNSDTVTCTLNITLSN